MNLIAILNRKTGTLVGFALNEVFGSGSTLNPSLAQKCEMSMHLYEILRNWNAVDKEFHYVLWQITEY